MSFLPYLFIISILAGQLIKLPLAGNLGPTVLDFFIITINTFGLIRLKAHLKQPPVFIKFVLIFISISTISLVFSPLHLNPMEYTISFFYTLRFFSYILFYWIIYSGGLNEIKNNTTNILIYSGIGLALLGLMQFIFLPDVGFLANNGWDPHYFRNVSTFLDPNFAGAFFALTLLVILNSIQDLSRSRYRRYVSIKYGMVILVYVALLTTFSRSSYLIFFTGGLILSFLNRSRRIFIITFILSFLLLFSFQLYISFITQPRNINREQSASFRVNTWQQGFNILQNSPLLGIGFNSYRYAIREYRLSDESFLNSHGSSSNDSSLLFVLATTGVIGFISYILFLIFLIRYSYKNNPVLTSAILGLIFGSFFVNNLFYPPIIAWIMLASQNPKK